ncbi:aminoacyl-tRNA deacylase [Anaeromyxobacter terrae]|uniref:aminoacyl-tRNA deacylase n=1 Tax=Anaeromyxobacter terrae TaxID=2925406 RepID=UPI001F5731D7|nr:YbaK/EbsC family protein [Anaeromyxobacter sp. SG22]
MIPSLIESHLRESHRGYEHHTHRTAMSAQELAAAEHVSGHRVAKAVVVSLDGLIAFAVVAATDRVSLSALEEATGRPAELVAESEFTPRFEPCEAGAEPPLAMFGVPIFVDEMLLQEKKLVMPGGTHEDAIVLDTGEWMRCEGVTAIAGLGATSARSDFGG